MDSALVMVTNRGGRIMSWKLTGYKDHAGRNLELIPESARAADLLPLSLRLDDEAATAAANSAFYRMEKSGLDDSQIGVVPEYSAFARCIIVIRAFI